MENYEIIKYLENFKNRLDELKKAIKLDEVFQQIKEFESLMTAPSFWDDAKASGAVTKQVKLLNEKVKSFKVVTDKIEELELYFEMYKNDGEDLMAEIERIIPEIEKCLNDLEVANLLSKEYDSLDCIVEMHPGAGGTESQDWASMLFRMYKRYAERHNYEVEIVDYLDGEEAGIKSVTFIVHGDYAYGQLKAEQGVHRLVRISPFDSNKRRHTSFCSVSVIPVMDDTIEIDIKPEDVRIDTYRSSGAGGQHVNKTDSAIRLTHLKTGIVVTCQNQRSQIQNKEKAFAILKSRLYQLEKQEKDKQIKEMSQTSSENGFGSQIRSYVFHPYSMVKDTRTSYEEYNTTSVMDGEIDGFINAYLKSEYNVG